MKNELSAQAIDYLEALEGILNDPLLSPDERDSKLGELEDVESYEEYAARQDRSLERSSNRR